MLYKLKIFLLTTLIITLTFASKCSDTCPRTLDGSCNNLRRGRESWGASGTFFDNGREGYEAYAYANLPKVSPLPKYADLSSIADVGPRNNARLISNTFCQRVNESDIDPLSHSNFAVFFGQFINHDLQDNRFVNGSSRTFEGLVTYLMDPTDPGCAAVPVPPSPFRCGANDTVMTIEARYSEGVYGPKGEFRVYNDATSWLDLNVVYGTDVETNRKLRTLRAGKMILETQTIGLVPPGSTLENFTFHDMLATWATTGLFNFDPNLLTRPTNWVFSSGDGRVNENAAVQTFHLIFTREHNLNAETVHRMQPDWDPVEHDEDIFECARAITIAKYQKIIYDQYFRSEFGPFFDNKLGKYKGYNSDINPHTLLSFSTAAFRYGHISLNSFANLDACGNKTLYGKPSTSDHPGLGVSAGGPNSNSPLGVIAVAGGFENLVRGIINQKAAPAFLEAPRQIRNVIIPNSVVDVLVVDIMRGRNNQLPNYQKVRSIYYGKNEKEDNIYGMVGCPAYLKNQLNVEDPLACFEIITGKGSPIAIKLKNVYKKIIHVDAMVGMLAEPHVEGTSFGRTTGHIIVEQFKRARDADRFFYEKIISEGYFSKKIAQEIKNTNMATLLRRVFPGIVVPENPFITPDNYRETLSDTC